MNQLGPITFHRKLLHRKLWGKQRELARAIRDFRSVSVKGCHGSGKTFLVAGMVPYELLLDPECIVLTIAPTLRQVKTLWNEITSAITSLPFKVPAPSTTMWKLGPHNYAQGFSSSKGVNAQGFHGKKVLIIVDEAIGISGDVWDAIEGVRAAGDVRIVKLCNPTVPSGPVFEDFTKHRGTPGHTTVTISAFDTPNLQGLNMETLLKLPEDDLDIAPFPWLTRRRWVREMYYKWGPTNPRFLARVLGEFPTEASDAVYQLAWIEAAGKPYEDEDLRESIKANAAGGLFIQIGIDVAGPGDDETAAYARIGPYIVDFAAWVKSDPFEDMIVWLGALQRRFPPAKLILVGDTVGVGYYFLRTLARIGYDVRAFVAGAAPVDQVLFKNAKAEGYWSLRQWMKEGHVHGVTDEDTKAQLSSIRYQETLRGQIEIEHKEDARERGVASPDRAEALVMAFVRLVARETTVMLNEPGAYRISHV